MSIEMPATGVFASTEFAFLEPPRGPDELGWFTDRYRVLRKLGQGGMGLVLLAEDRTLGRQVALKVMLPRGATHPEAKARFLAEAQSMARYHHVRIVAVHDTGEVRGVPYLTMPLLEGETLHERLERKPAPTLAEALRIVRETAEGLAVAHRAGQIHRDIKPGNLWLTAPDGTVVLLDFGLARQAERDALAPHTQTGAVVGTPHYMSPEQAGGRELDARSDLFALGVILYQMLTGQQPFTGNSITAVLLQVVSHNPAPPCDVQSTIPQAISDFTMRLLAKDPADRPASAAEVVETLSQLEAGGDTLSFRSTRTATPPRPRSDPAKGRRSWLLVGITVGLLALLAGALYAFLAKGDPAKTLPPASPRGYVDVLLAEKQGQAVRMHLSDYGSLPARNGDRFRIEVHADVPAYLYLFWLTCEGEAVPVYPWQPGKWGTRPETEEPRTDLELPATKTNGYKFSGTGTGMESLILLGRATPLAATDDEIQKWFADVRPQRTLADARSAVWFVDGKIVEDGARKRQHFEEGEINNATLQLQALLQERLSSVASFTAAVCFAKQAK